MSFHFDFNFAFEKRNFTSLTTLIINRFFQNSIFSLTDRIFRGGNENIFASSGPVWEALRKVGFLAVRLQIN
jgi:hypothetical protein